MKIAIVLGTRPEIIKMSPVIRECKKRKIDFFIIHTNQHYSEKMDSTFFEELKLPQAKYNIGISNESLQGRMIAKMLIGIEKILIDEKPDWVLVEGDTNTVLAGALASRKLGIRLGHLEAGLRSYDNSMPEETNRIITDHISDLLFAPTKKQRNILLKEGINKEKIYVTGNTIVDAVFQNLVLAKKRVTINTPEDKNYFTLTMHRPSNVDDKKTLRDILKSLEESSKKLRVPIFFFVHPRTRHNLFKFKIKIDQKLIKLIPPVGYLEMLKAEQNSKLILTDSGGLQEEACILKVPCVTLRKNTERPETIDIGSNVLAFDTKVPLSKIIKSALAKKNSWKNPYGKGKTGEKIIDIIMKYA